MKIVRDMFDQLWTLLGMFIAWVVLDGSAKTIVGWAILWSTLIWLVSMGIREKREEDLEDESNSTDN